MADYKFISTLLLKKGGILRYRPLSHGGDHSDLI